MMLGIIFVGIFSFFADDLNYWFHQRVTVEHPKTDSATRYSEPAQPPSRLPDGGRKVPAWWSNATAEDHASTGSGQNGAAISRSDLLTNRAERPIEVSGVAKVEAGVDRGTADEAAQATAAQGASSGGKMGRSDPSTNASGGVHASVAESVTSSDVAAAEEKTNGGEQRIEPAQKDVTAQASSQALDEARRGDAAKADAEVGGTNVDAAAKPSDMAGVEETTNEREQRSEPAQNDLTSQGPSHPLDEARRGDVAKADAEVGGTNVDAAAKPNDMAAVEETTNEREQRSEPAQKDLTLQASLQPLDEARRSDVAKADTEVGGTNVDAAAKPIDMPAKQTSNLPRASEQPKDVAAIAAASQSRDDAPGHVTARAPSSGGDHWVITDTVSPVDYSPVVTAWISSKPGASGLRMTFHCRRGRTEVQLVGHRSDTSVAKNTRDTVVAYSINDDASIAQRWDVRGSVAAFRGDAVAFLRSLPEHGELTARVSDGNSVLHEGRFVLDGLSHVRDRFASACRWPEAGAAPASQAEAVMRKTSRRGKTQ